MKCTMKIIPHSIAATLLLVPHLGLCEEARTLVIKEHRFHPADVQVPAGQKIKLIVDNQDDDAEEFESHALNREKVIPANAKVTIYVGPLKPGTYEFFGEFNESTARGRIIAE